jgi:hypothetical protein
MNSAQKVIARPPEGLLTDAEAIELTGRLKGLMPRLTDEQALAVRQQLRKCTRSLATAAIDGYAGRATDFVLAEFLKLLGSDSMVNDSSGPLRRTAAMLAQEREAADANQKYWEAIRQRIGELGYDQLQRLRAELLDELEEKRDPLAGLVAKLDPRRSPLVMELLMRRMDAQAREAS